MSTQKIEGWRLVPVEPTAEMVQAGRNEPLAGEADEDAPEDYRAVYRAMLAAAPACPSAAAAPKWISVEERLPQEGRGSSESDSVLVCLNDCVRTVGFYCHYESDWYGEDGRSFEDASTGPVTHWMPLPAPLPT